MMTRRHLFALTLAAVVGRPVYTHCPECLRTVGQYVNGRWVSVRWAWACVWAGEPYAMCRECYTPTRWVHHYPAYSEHSTT